MPFGQSIQSSSIQENWLFKLSNNNSGYLYLAFTDVTYNSNFYHGAIIGKPAITETINLDKSTASTSGLSISIPDFNYRGNPISKELWGTNSYLNRECTVHSQINDDSPNQIGAFRVSGISNNGNTIKINMISHRPWDNITIPQNKSDTQVYEPIAYGDFTKNTESTTALTTFLPSMNLFPCPNANYAINGQVLFVYPKAYTSDAKPHFYDSNIDKFIPFTDANDNTNSSSISVNTVGVPIDMERGYFWIRPTSPSGFSSSSNATDTDTTTYATGTATPSTATSGSTEDVTTLSIDLPTVDGELTELYVYVKADLTHTDTSGVTNSFLSVYKGSDDSVAGNILLVQTPNDGTVSTSDETVVTTNYVNYNKVSILGETSFSIKVRTTAQSIGGASPSNGDGQGVAKIYDIVIKMKLANDTTNEKTASLDKLSKLKAVYTGADGLTKTYDGGSGTVTEIHEAHRALLNDHAGLDDSDSDIEGWGALNSSKDWGIRYWVTEETLLKDVLEKLQFEGGFIFRDRFGLMQYIHIPDSISGVITLTKNDIANISILNTSLTQLRTKKNISYEKHPADSRYMTTQTFTNATPRTTYNIQTKENIESVNLDAYVSPTIPSTPANSGNKANRNDDHASYYNAINGDVFLECSFDIVNPKFYDLEVGDFITFDNDNMYPETPFGQSSGTWTNINMMIVSTKRTLGKLSIKAREV